MGVLEDIVGLIFKKGIVVYKSQLSKTVYHIRIQSDILKTIEYRPGDFLRILVGEGKSELSFREKVRSYSVWNLDKEKCEIDLAVTIHGKGPGAQWAKDCQEGDGIKFIWHKGKYNIDSSADDYVFIGDLSALSTFYEFNRSLIGKNIYDIIYSQHTYDVFADVDGKEPFGFCYLPNNPSAQILKKLETLKDKLATNTNVYVAGDSRVCVAVSQFLRKEWKLNSRQIKAKPYWNPEKTGLE